MADYDNKPEATQGTMDLIEVLSYLIRPISLSVRLFVNMTAGHIMLKTFAGFIRGSTWVIVGSLAVLVFMALTNA